MSQFYISNWSKVVGRRRIQKECLKRNQAFIEFGNSEDSTFLYKIFPADQDSLQTLLVWAYENELPVHFGRHNKKSIKSPLRVHVDLFGDGLFKYLKYELRRKLNQGLFTYESPSQTIRRISSAAKKEGGPANKEL